MGNGNFRTTTANRDGTRPHSLSPQETSTRRAPWAGAGRPAEKRQARPRSSRGRGIRCLAAAMVFNVDALGLLELVRENDDAATASIGAPWSTSSRARVRMSASACCAVSTTPRTASTSPSSAAGSSRCPRLDLRPPHRPRHHRRLARPPHRPRGHGPAPPASPPPQPHGPRGRHPGAEGSRSDSRPTKRARARSGPFPERTDGLRCGVDGFREARLVQQRVEKLFHGSLLCAQQLQDPRLLRRSLGTGCGPA